MDAVKYLKERHRICESMANSDARCPFGFACIVCERQRTEIDHPEEAVRIVEEWSKAHPRQTNADKFKEVFGVTPFNDLLEDYVCPPSTARGETGCSLKRCDECSHSYWDKPYEAPKGD